MRLLLLAIALFVTGCSGQGTLSDAIAYCESTNGGFTEKGQALCNRLRGQ